MEEQSFVQPIPESTPQSVPLKALQTTLPSNSKEKSKPVNYKTYIIITLLLSPIIKALLSILFLFVCFKFDSQESLVNMLGPSILTTFLTSSFLIYIGLKKFNSKKIAIYGGLSGLVIVPLLLVLLFKIQIFFFNLKLLKEVAGPIAEMDEIRSQGNIEAELISIKPEYKNDKPYELVITIKSAFPTSGDYGFNATMFLPQEKRRINFSPSSFKKIKLPGVVAQGPVVTEFSLIMDKFNNYRYYDTVLLDLSYWIYVDIKGPKWSSDIESLSIDVDHVTSLKNVGFGKEHSKDVFMFNLKDFVVFPEENHP